MLRGSLVTVILFFVLCTGLPAQKRSTAELKADWDLAHSPEEKIVLGLRLGRAYQFTLADSSIYFLGLVRDIAREHGLDSLHASVLFQLAEVNALRSDFSLALHLTEEARQKFPTSSGQKYLQYLKAKARYLEYGQQIDSAIYYLLLYDDQLSAEGKEAQRFLSQFNLSEIYYNLGNQKTAEEHLKKALDIARVERNPMDYLYVLAGGIHQYEVWGRYKAASDLREEYLRFKLERGDRPSDLLKAVEHYHTNTPDRSPAEVERTLIQYLDANTESDRYLTIAQVCYNLGNLYLDQDRVREAIAVFNRGLAAADSVHMPALSLNLNLALYQAYRDAGMPEKALVYHEELYRLREAIRDSEREAALNELVVKYETDKKDAALETAELALQASQQRQRFIVFVSLALLGCVCAILYAFFAKRKHNRVLQEKNQIITRSLAEKDILLKEIHHRVKNNLQMISALLYLHGKSIQDVTAQEALLESQNRVQSMAMIHQNLYQDANLLGVGVKEYLDKLFRHLISSYNIEQDRVTIHKQVEIEHLDVDTIVPVALIVNELISNALKYAFRDGRRGELSIFLGSREGKTVLEVRDNGVGFPPGFSLRHSPNFGFKLIEILRERLGATLDMENQDGVCIRLTMPLKAAA